jgi:Flp pilus assembly protein TadG
MNLRLITARAVAGAARFADCRRGGVVIIFALAMSVLFGVTGLAIDYARLASARTKLQNATDTALLAAVRTLGITQNSGKATETANAYFAQAMGTDRELLSASLTGLTVNMQKQSVTGFGSARFQPTFLQVVGFQPFPISVPSSADGAVGEMEISVMIDLSSSMTGRRFSELRTTLTEFVEQMMRSNNASGPVKMAFAPFASAVNPGTYFNTVSVAPAGRPALARASGSAPSSTPTRRRRRAHTSTCSCRSPAGRACRR